MIISSWRFFASRSLLRSLGSPINLLYIHIKALPTTVSEPIRDASVPIFVTMTSILQLLPKIKSHRLFGSFRLYVPCFFHNKKATLSSNLSFVYLLFIYHAVWFKSLIEFCHNNIFLHVFTLKVVNKNFVLAFKRIICVYTPLTTISARTVDQPCFSVRVW